MVKSNFSIGDKVQKPGAYFQGVGPILTITNVSDDGDIIYLSNGSWEFAWNIIHYIIPPKEKESILDGSALARDDDYRLKTKKD